MFHVAIFSPLICGENFSYQKQKQNMVDLISQRSIVLIALYYKDRTVFDYNSHYKKTIF
uniref:Uncharacterized protein n=1 Tax=Rhizophora mucronata TaxID=61149 RepID=A0A2P2PPE6_RHIMU